MAQTRRMGMPNRGAQPPKRRGFRPTFFGYCGRARLCGGAHGSNPAHGENMTLRAYYQKRRGFRLPLWVLRARRGSRQMGMSQPHRQSRPQDLQEERANATYIATFKFRTDGPHSYSR
jgi:hypothetical protein